MYDKLRNRIKSMKIIVPLLCFFMLFACARQKKDDGAVTKKPGPVVVNRAVNTGWQDKDTYTVQVTAETEEIAVDMAHHTILKDIVRVRLTNGSRYTDIAGIKKEFDRPLKNGKIVKREKAEDGILIYYQIRDRDLRSKFERK